MEPGGRGDGDGCAGVPFVLSAGVGVDVDFAADDGHGLGTRRSHRRPAPPPGRRRAGLRRRAGVFARRRGGSGRRRPARCGGCPVCRTRPAAGNATAPAAGRPCDCQRDVDRPVCPRRLTVLAGPVEGVDDPDAVALEPDPVVHALLRKHGVVGTSSASRRRSSSFERRSPSAPLRARIVESSAPASAARRRGDAHGRPWRSSAR